jgi:ubiquinone/menaquinone biosynthesis C-methylase UbiE
VSDEQFVGKLTEVLKSSNRKVGGQVEDWHDVAVDWSINLFPISFPTEVIRREEWSKGFFDKQDKIIDIGANRGDAFLGWDRSRITSVDIDKYDYEGFVQAQAEDLPFPDKSFDKALLGEIVEHSKTPVKVLQEANRVANMSVITVPYEVEWEEQYYPFNTKEKELARRRKDLKEIAKEGNQEAKEFAGDNFDHLWHQTFYTPELLYAHLKEAGFKDIKITKLRHNGVSWLGAVAK